MYRVTTSKVYVIIHIFQTQITATYQIKIIWMVRIKPTLDMRTVINSNRQIYIDTINCRSDDCYGFTIIKRDKFFEPVICIDWRITKNIV